MKDSFKKAFRIFKSLSIIFSIAYWIYIVINDFQFIEKYWASNWPQYLGVWTVYFLVYFFEFAFCFWIVAATIIYRNHKLVSQ